MPELPEVTALASFLSGHMVGHSIADLDVVSVAALKTFAPNPDAVAGSRVTAVTRRGKFLVVEILPHYLVVHLAKAGWLRWFDTAPSLPPSRRGPLAARLRLDDSSGFDLTEQGHQKRMAIYLVDDLRSVPGIARLGIDALDPDLSAAMLGQMLRGAGATHLKTLIADQTKIAGIGNAYSDEILHVAQLSPFRPADKLDPPEITRLHTALRDVLAEAVASAAGRPAKDLKDTKRQGMRVHGRTGLPCPICAATVRQVDLGNRSMQYCPGCQTGGRVYADRRLSKLLR